MEESEKEKIELENLITEQRIAIEKFRQKLTRQNNSQGSGAGEKLLNPLNIPDDFKPKNSMSPGAVFINSIFLLL